MNKTYLALAALGLLGAGSALFAPAADSNSEGQVIIYCEPENGTQGFIVCSYSPGGELIGKEEVECPKQVGANGEDCPPYIEPWGGENYPPTHDN